jgi:hypothetical protein
MSLVEYTEGGVVWMRGYIVMAMRLSVSKASVRIEAIGWE